MKKNHATKYECDVLILGGGFAGLWAALRAKEFTDQVIVVDKARVAKSGCSTFAAGVQFCPTEEDDLDIWKKEIVEASDYFTDQYWIDVFLNNQLQRIKDYENWGAPIERDENGKIARMVGRGHINTRLFQFHGSKLMEILRRQAIKKRIKIVERVMILDFLTSDGEHPTQGRVVGAIGMQTRTGDFVTFSAKSVVLATGAIAIKHGDVTDNCVGDGVAAAFRCGTELTNLEFLTTGNITTWERKGFASATNMIQGYGGYFVNALGERFMEKYDSTLKERALLYKICMGFCKEALEGRGPNYVDLRHLPHETFEKFKRVLPTAMTFFTKAGIDIGKQKIECMPEWGVNDSSGAGGVKIDYDCKTNISGLYAAGAVIRNPVQGIYALGGIASASCNVMGYIAGENAAKRALDIDKVELHSDQIEHLKKQACFPSEPINGLTPIELFTRIHELTIPAPASMFKSKARIINILSELAKINERLPEVIAVDPHELVKANELKNYILCCELVFRAAMERKESRQSHYREDYPYKDDIEWLKLIVFRNVCNSIEIDYENIPISEWQIKPDKFVKTSHSIQFFIRK